MKHTGLHIKCPILFELGKLELSTDLISSEYKITKIHAVGGRFVGVDG